ncbi:MAG: hypothetical protein NC923_00155 [Candidatus Omnitrophica bacterium]|nr:hypothetical protein [Candidatus Omnitrophota bacterium]
MKRIVFMVIAVLFVAGVAFSEEAGLVIDNFEGIISGGPDGTVDFGAGNGSSLQVSAATEQVHSGKQSLRAAFDAVSGGYMYIARGEELDAKNAAWLVKANDIKWSDFKGISFWMYGAGSKEDIAFDVKDNGGEMWRFITSDDVKGWKQVICIFDHFFARTDWQPESADKNGILDFPIKSYQFEPLPVAKGTLYFDDVELIKK